MSVHDKPQDTRSSDSGANAVQKASQGTELSAEEQRSALDFLLGAPEPAFYTVDLQFDTPQGLKPLRVKFKALDGRSIDKIEQSNISDATGKMDKPKADAELFAAAVVGIEDPDSARVIEVTSEDFRTIKPGDAPLASTTDALNVRFGKQAGLLAGVALAIREAAGWKSDRVGQASRVLVGAAGN